MESPPETRVSSALAHFLWPGGLALLGVLSLFVPKLGLPAAFLAFLGFLTRWHERLVLQRALLGVAALSSAVGLVRFVIVEAMPGIVGGGREAVQRRVVSRLRDLAFAQGRVRELGWIDNDRDGRGAGALLVELCGGAAQQGQPERSEPVLDCGELVPTHAGLAAQSGPYLYLACLPAQGGGWVADTRRELRELASQSRAVDEEAAERQFFAFAWPEVASGFDNWFFIDERDAILMGKPLPAPGQTSAEASCDAVWASLESGLWTPWRGKKPRS